MSAAAYLAADVAAFLSHWSDVLTSLLGVAAGILASAVPRVIENLRARKLAKEAAFSTALESDDLGELGAYLRNELGEVSLNAYLNDGGVRQRVDRYLAKLTAFVALPREPEEPGPLGDKVLQPSSTTEFYTTDAAISWALDKHPDDPRVLTLAIDSILAGESWSGLASLRRDLENRFRALAPDVHRRQPITRNVPEEVRREFAMFYRIASRAIHGEDISTDEMLSAVETARALYAWLRFRAPHLQAPTQ